MLFTFAPVAQQAEHVLGKDGVTGSTPVGGLNLDEKTMREHIIFECTVCNNRLYTSTKNKKLKQGRIELKKFCRFCRKHIIHKEVK